MVTIGTMTKPATARRVVRAAAAAVILLLLAGCKEPSPEAVAVSKAFDALQTAIYTGDAGALWDLSVPDLHQEVHLLRERMAKATQVLDDVYSAEEARVIRRDIGGDLLDNVTEDRQLFIALAPMGGAERSDEIKAGLEHDPATINGKEATVETRGGEVYRFFKGDDDVWRSDLALEAFRSWPSLKTLIANLDRVDENVEAMRRQRDLLRDARTPEGAFNMLREALVGQNMDVVYTLLTPASRDGIRTAIDAWAALPEATRKESVAGLCAACAAALEGAPDVRTVLRRLLEADALKEPIPLTATDRVDHVERVSDGLVDVHTTRSKTVRLVRGDKDVWRADALEAWARTAVIEPLGRLPQQPAEPSK